MRRTPLKTRDCRGSHYDELVVSRIGVPATEFYGLTGVYNTAISRGTGLFRLLNIVSFILSDAKYDTRVAVVRFRTPRNVHMFMEDGAVGQEAARDMLLLQRSRAPGSHSEAQMDPKSRKIRLHYLIGGTLVPDLCSISMYVKIYYVISVSEST